MIVDNAIAFPWERPLRDLTVGTLVAGTTLSRSAFHLHFEDLHHPVESLLDEVEATMRRTVNPWPAGEGEPVEALRAALAGVVQACVEHDPVFRVVSEAAPPDARLERAWWAFMGRWDEAVEARIVIRQRDGLIPSELDARRTAHALNAMDAAMLIAAFGSRPQGDPDATLAALQHIWTATLYGPLEPFSDKTWKPGDPELVK